jgi:hypothetical protein
MTVQQTLTIPKTTTHLSVDLPEPIPAGTATFWLNWAETEAPREDWRSLYGFCKDSGDTLDAFMERHNEEGRLELEKEERERRERL